MYRLTINGKPIGKDYQDEEEVIKAFTQLFPCFLGLGWRKA